MKKLVVAVPSTLPGGLDAAVSQHFGHCEVYTLLEVAGGCVHSVTTLPGVPHQSGGCMQPVLSLAQQGVTALIAASIGRRPLSGCSELGIEVFRSQGERSVAAAINDFLTGALERYALSASCTACAH